ncbi:hypothetical protein CCHR01_14770 [Colletotrichum chrysophilum]|uniref:Uncharacterized protein n=1 Tax=Colletotrichum chrysophilum TaxID=1836956 RepID=A0AAD9EBZ1_9PEZI|nr:hypothetical protein CCHR01_14770 [Colletotrichum chrysophilum]
MPISPSPGRQNRSVPKHLSVKRVRTAVCSPSPQKSRAPCGAVASDKVRSQVPSLPSSWFLPDPESGSLGAMTSSQRSQLRARRSHAHHPRRRRALRSSTRQASHAGEVCLTELTEMPLGWGLGTPHTENSSAGEGAGTLCALDRESEGRRLGRGSCDK